MPIDRLLCTDTHVEVEMVGVASVLPHIRALGCAVEDIPSSATMYRVTALGPLIGKLLGRMTRRLAASAVSRWSGVVRLETEVGTVDVGSLSSTPFTISTGTYRTIPIALFQHPQLFSGRNPYGNENGPYPDNWRRYAAFARAVLASFELLNFSPAIIHDAPHTIKAGENLHLRYRTIIYPTNPKPNTPEKEWNTWLQDR